MIQKTKQNNRQASVFYIAKCSEYVVCICGRLRRLPETLLRFPCDAVYVQLAGFKPPRRCQESESIPYSPEWSMKTMLEMIDLLHGKLRAVVVVCGS